MKFLVEQRNEYFHFFFVRFTMQSIKWFYAQKNVYPYASPIKTRRNAQSCKERKG